MEKCFQIFIESIKEGEKKEEGFIIGGESPITMTMFNNTWRRIKKTVDLHGATPHVLRHPYVKKTQKSQSIVFSDNCVSLTQKPT